jgi:Mrp family chromosome partitioning ATPase
MHQLLKVSNAKGFSEVVMGEVPWREAVQQTSVENLSVIPRGKLLSQASRFFLSKTMDRFLEEVVKEFDLVILDSCPILATDDTTSLAPKVDGALFVVRMGFSTSQGIRMAHDLLKERQVKLMGTVLNAVDAAFDSHYYYSYTSYYPGVTPALEGEAK